LLVPLQQFLVDPRDVVVALGKGVRREFDQVLEADDVLRQQREVEAGVAALLGLLFRALAGRDVRLVADDGVDTAGGTLAVERGGAGGIAVVRDSQGFRAEAFSPLSRSGEAAGPVGEAVVGGAGGGKEGAGYSHTATPGKGENRSTQCAPRQ